METTTTTLIPRRSTRRHPWTPAEAAAALAAAEVSGTSLRRFALRHGISAGVLYRWRNARHTTGAAPATEPPALRFVPVVGATAPRSPSPCGSGVALHVGAVRVHLDAGFCEQTLARVVALLGGGTPC